MAPQPARRGPPRGATTSGARDRTPSAAHHQAQQEPDGDGDDVITDGPPSATALLDSDAVAGALLKELQPKHHRETTPGSSPHRKRQRINGDRYF
jgi:hypothetical protein